MKVSPYVNFKGQCAEAFRYYEQHLGGRIQMIMTFAESPMKEQTAADWQDKVMMPFQKTFWSPGFGMTVDRFGVPWMIGTEAAA